jgi:DNA-directed RNA polymerase specialized sigma24 family protein
VEAVLTRIRREPDAVLAALLRLGQGGDQLALLVVLKAMLGKLVLLSGGRSDVLIEAVSELWLAMAEYPLARRPRSIAANLSWTVSRRIRASPPRPSASLTTEPAGAPSDPDASTTLADARRLGLIDELTHRTLWTVYVAGLTSYQAAAVLNTTPDMVRWRCSRAIRRLRDQAELLAS